MIVALVTGEALAGCVIIDATEDFPDTVLVVGLPFRMSIQLVRCGTLWAETA